MILSYDEPHPGGAPFRIADPFIPDDVYPHVVERTVITCADVVFYDEDDRQIYLAKRVIEPAPGLWVIGGRMLILDPTPADAIQRLVEHECKRRLDKERFVYLADAHYRWRRTAQSEYAGANFVVVHKCAIRKGERIAISANLTRAEYEPDFGLQGFGREDLTKPGIHPVLLDFYNLIFGNDYD